MTVCLGGNKSRGDLLVERSPVTVCLGEEGVRERSPVTVCLGESGPRGEGVRERGPVTVCLGGSGATAESSARKGETAMAPTPSLSAGRATWMGGGPEWITEAADNRHLEPRQTRAATDTATAIARSLPRTEKKLHPPVDCQESLNPEMTSRLSRLPKNFVKRLEADSEGKIVVAMARLGIFLDPPPAAKIHLQNEFGLYTGGGSDPFEGVLENFCEVEDDLCNVGMMRAGSEISAGDGGMKLPGWLTNPFLTDMLTSWQKPKFSGCATDYRSFSRKWEEYYTFVKTTCPDQIPDAFWLRILKGCLDPVSQGDMDRELERDPNLSLATFWKKLEKVFGRDMSMQYRDDWERVTLRGIDDLNWDTFREFRISFELAVGRVEDTTEAEVERRLLAELPGKWRMKVNEEILRRQNGQFWVRFLKPTPVSADHVQRLVAQMTGKATVNWVERKTEYMADCGSEDGRCAVLTLNTWGSGEGRLKVSSAERPMTATEIFNFIEARLYAKRKVEEYDSKTVHALASSSSESLVGKGDKSRTNSPVSRRSDPEGGGTWTFFTKKS